MCQYSKEDLYSRPSRRSGSAVKDRSPTMLNENSYEQINLISPQTYTKNKSIPYTPMQLDTMKILSKARPMSAGLAEFSQQKRARKIDIPFYGESKKSNAPFKSYNSNAAKGLTKSFSNEISVNIQS